MAEGRTPIWRRGRAEFQGVANGHWGEELLGLTGKETDQSESDLDECGAAARIIWSAEDRWLRAAAFY